VLSFSTAPVAAAATAATDATSLLAAATNIAATITTTATIVLLFPVALIFSVFVFCLVVKRSTGSFVMSERIAPQPLPKQRIAGGLER
jgi:hypothetical protein